MGKHKAQQAKLSFRKNLLACQLDHNSPPETSVKHTEIVVSHDVDLKELLFEVKSSLKLINAKIDILTNPLERAKQRVDKYEHLLDLLENHVSDADDTQTDPKDHLLKLDKILDLIKIKNEDLEARSRRNYSRIVGVPKSPEVAKMEDYIEALLRDLFSKDLSSSYIVECTHHSLEARPSPALPARPIIACFQNYHAGTPSYNSHEKGSNFNIIVIHSPYTQTSPCWYKPSTAI
ncbi:hypothetical protein NDU88_006134 [Pleurodeles waltl]|uniref:Uncharacterized protein n=1 Tax=Pleurodeles waltl TaxID=8319 RepID=A0AAV7RR02_PLEWA|nr:hypothetical protein NDU88_006134 [Pleurodeles waltl]